MAKRGSGNRLGGVGPRVGGLKPKRGNKRRPSPRLQAMLRGLLRKNKKREVDTEPRPDCNHALAGGNVIYCTDRSVKARVGGAAVRCMGKQCGRADLPPKPKSDEDE